MNHPYLAIDQDVIFVDADKKNHKGKITQVLTHDAARVEWDNGKHAAVAEFSDKKEPNTFHFEQDASSPAEASAKAGPKAETTK